MFRPVSLFFDKTAESLPYQDFASWQVSCLTTLQYLMLASIICLVPIVLLEKQSFALHLTRNILLAFLLTTFISWIALYQGFEAYPKIGMIKALALVCFTAVSFASFIMMFIKILPLLSKKKKISWHFLWIPLYAISYIGSALVGRI